MGPERRKSNKLSSSFHKSWQAFSWILRKFGGEEKETERNGFIKGKEGFS